MNTTSQETSVSREYFYAGGQYVDDGTGTGQHVFKDQIYVEKLSPGVKCPKPYPLVLIHGQAQTGTVSVSPDVDNLAADKSRIGLTNLMDLLAGHHTSPRKDTRSISWIRRLVGDRHGSQAMAL